MLIGHGTCCETAERCIPLLRSLHHIQGANDRVGDHYLLAVTLAKRHGNLLAQTPAVVLQSIFTYDQLVRTCSKPAPAGNRGSNTARIPGSKEDAKRIS